MMLGIVFVALCSSLFAQGKYPLILIPGLTGSELVNERTGDKIWFRAIKSGSEDLRLPISVNIEKVRDDIIPGDIIRTIKIGPLSVTDVYGGFIKAMEVRGGYKEEKWETPSAEADHDSLFVFSYDWRLDNVGNARRLIESIEALKRKLKKPDLKFDVVAHSLGGILARYAAMYGDAELPVGKARPTWAGAKHFDKIILLGTPNEGSISSFNALLNGYAIGGLRIDLPFLEDTSKFTIFTIPSAYQLLPAPGTLRAFNDQLEPLNIDLYDPKTWSRYGWNTIDDKDFPNRFSIAERKIAPQFFAAQLARAKRLHEALAAVNGKASGVSFFLLGSDCRTAPDSVVIYRERDSWKTLFRPKSISRPDGTKLSDDDMKKVMFMPGDGVVTARSLEALTQSEAARVRSILDVDRPKLICEEHHKLASNSRVQDHIISVFDAKNTARTEKERN